jgi:hypothetical protein
MADVRSCRAFQDSSYRRIIDARSRIQEHDSRPEVTDQSKAAFARWALEGVNRTDMAQYDQVYKQEFMEIRRLLILNGIEDEKPGTDYANPGNGGGVTGICLDLSQLTEAYVNREYAKGKITFDEGRRYLGRPPLAPR